MRVNRITVAGLLMEAALGKDVTVLVAHSREARVAFDVCVNLAGTSAEKIVRTNGRESLTMRDGGKIQFATQHQGRGLKADVMFLDEGLGRDHELIRDLVRRNPETEIVRA